MIALGDAQAALSAAVGLLACSLSRRDVDRSGTVGSGDALRILRAIVGIDVALLCPAACL